MPNLQRRARPRVPASAVVAGVACLALGTAALCQQRPAIAAQTQPIETPRGQTAAGGKMEFDAVSIHPIKPGEFTPPNFDLTAGKNWWQNGLYKADFPVLIYIAFAYKLFPTSAEEESLLAHQSKWVSEEGMAIRMRASGNPTKDQARSMMQSMLADRFKLALHFETREVPVLALTLIGPGKLG